MEKIVDTRIARIKFDDEGIVIITMREIHDIDHEDVLDVNLVIRHLGNNEPVLKLLDTRAPWKISDKATKDAIMQDGISTTRARAIIVSNSIQANLLSLMKQFDKKGYPQQYFSDYDEAYKWLLSIKNKQ